MPATSFSPRWLVWWLVFYLAVLPSALPRCLDWLSRPSNALLGWGGLGLAALAAGVALSLYQAGRGLARRLLRKNSDSSFFSK